MCCGNIMSRVEAPVTGCHGVSVFCDTACVLCSHRWAESTTLPDIAADLQSIQSELGITAHQKVDFILIRDDMVAREVTLPHCDLCDFLLALATSYQNYIGFTVKTWPGRTQPLKLLLM